MSMQKEMSVAEVLQKDEEKQIQGVEIDAAEESRDDEASEAEEDEELEEDEDVDKEARANEF
jgi:hypothetical protein